MKIRNGDTPIQLPEMIRSGDPISAKWANSIRAAIQRLRDRVPVGIDNARPTKYVHPFQIIPRQVKISDDPVEYELRLYVNYGQAFASSMVKWIEIPTVTENFSQIDEIMINSGALLNDPSGAEAGYITLSATNNYGIWLRGQYTGGATTSPFFPSTALMYGYMTVDAYRALFTEIIVDSTYNTPDTNPDDEHIWLYLGSVDVDANLFPAVTQWWKSDIMLPSFLMPRVEVSSDAGNSAYISSADGKLYVPPIVSSDANNSITTGADGGAFYDEP
jgi:hypothetical protein